MSKSRFFLSVMILVGLLGCAHTPRKGNPLVEEAKIAFAQQDYATAIELLTPLAAAGDPDAQYALGYIYFYGIGTPPQVMRGRELIQSAAQKNHRMALKALDIIAQHEASLATYPNEKEIER